jgi:hypothetical protein
MRVWLGVGVLFAALAVAGVLGAPGSSAVGTCSAAEAETLAEKFDMGDVNYGRVAQVLCGPFTGSQSNAMAFSFHWYGCIPVAGWAVFRFTGSDWQLVLRRDRERAVLAAAGSDIQATVDVVRTGDSLCISTGGVRSQLWHWDGTRLVAAPWKQTSPAKQPDFGGFRTPSGNIFCNNAVGEGAKRNPVYFLQCAIKSGLKPPAPRKGPRCTRALWVSMVGSGHAAWSGSTCPGRDEPQGPIIQQAKQVLRYGQHWSWRGMSCSSTFRGLTCRNRSGHGFFMSRALTRLF